MSTLGRGVLLIWLFVVLIIQSSYTASLTSILTVQQLDTSIRGLDDLKNSDYPIGFQVGSFVEEYMIKELNISQSRLKALGSPEQIHQIHQLNLVLSSRRSDSSIYIFIKKEFQTLTCEVQMRLG